MARLSLQPNQFTTRLSFIMDGGSTRSIKAGNPFRSATDPTNMTVQAYNHTVSIAR